jgi:ATP phosphoribosyltransferase
VVVAVPEAWVDVVTMADLEDVAADFRPRHGRRLRVATKYLTLTRRFFAEHGLTDYRIVESLGATEGAPASGVADLIVDITTTGTTLRANALKRLDDGLILASEAYLVTSLTAPWPPAALASLKLILDRIQGEAAGRALREVKADPTEPAKAAYQAAARFGATVPFGIAADGPLALHCEAGKAPALADWLRSSAGARTVTIGTVDTVFSAENPVYDRLVKSLGRHG